MEGLAARAVMKRHHLIWDAMVGHGDGEAPRATGGCRSASWKSWQDRRMRREAWVEALGAGGVEAGVACPEVVLASAERRLSRTLHDDLRRLYAAAEWVVRPVR